MYAALPEPLYLIDNIEELKRSYHATTGQHLAVKLRRNSVDVRITAQPIRPVMLPLKRPPRLARIRNSIRIKVKKG